VVELRALRARQPELASAVDMHLELFQLQRRIQARVPLPGLDVSAEVVARHQAEARPLLRFDTVPLDLTDLRLIVRQTADILRRAGALEPADHARIQALARDPALRAVVADWYRQATEQHAGRHAPARAGAPPITGAPRHGEQDGMLEQVLTVAMHPFLSRCAEVLQPRPELALWTHPFCALCGGEPELAAITPSAERHLICGRCSLRWKFAALTCPFCLNGDRSRITSFATPDAHYRVYACDVCRRYLKAYDGRRASRPIMPIVDTVATLPLDAAAIQRGYSS
jgi:hypothetical protein